MYVYVFVYVYVRACNHMGLCVTEFSRHYVMMLHVMMLPFPCGWALIGFLIIYHNCWCFVFLEWRTYAACLRLICVWMHVTSHCYTQTHTRAWVNTHTAQGPVTAPWRGCWVWFYCLYWSWLSPSWGIDLWIIWVQGGGVTWPLPHSRAAGEQEKRWIKALIVLARPRTQIVSELHPASINGITPALSPLPDASCQPGATYLQ